MIKQLLKLKCTMIAGAVFTTLCLITPPAATALEKGEQAPHFSLPSASGKTLSLSDYRGKVVLLDFWASWCGPCKKSLPWLESIRGAFSPDKFVVITINLDEDREEGLRFFQTLGLTIPVVFDPAGSVPESYNLKSMPESFLIDENGVLIAAYKGFGERHKTQILDDIEKLLQRGKMT